MTSLIEYSLQRGDETNEFIINDVKAIMFANGEPCSGCLVIEKQEMRYDPNRDKWRLKEVK